MKRPEHDRFRLTRGLPPTSLLHAVIASSNRPVGRPPCMKEPEFRRILRPVGQLFLVKSGATKQPPRSWSLLRCARDDMDARRVNPKLSWSGRHHGSATTRRGPEWRTRDLSGVCLDEIQ